MSDSSRREADRLRVIIETLAHSNPGMTMAAAAPAIFEIEKKAAKLELDRGTLPLPDTLPTTVAAYINTQADIIDLINLTKKLDAIKEVRRRTSIGLKEAKDGVDYWLAHFR